MHRIGVASALVFLSAFSVEAQSSLRLKSPSQGQRLQGKRLGAGRLHRIVPFGHPPQSDDIAGIAARGGVVLHYVPENALMVSLPEDSANTDLGFPLGIAEKWSPELSEADEGFFVVEFFPDTDPGEARAIVDLAGMAILNHPDLMPNHLLVEGSSGQARSLAEWDAVDYIFPASDDLVQGKPVQPCAGAVTTQGSVGNYVPVIGDGWDGPGKGAAVLRYFFTNVTSKVPADAGKAEILRGLNEWAKSVQVSFLPGSGASGTRTVNILFASGAHGDAYPFDGPGGVLAHTFYPSPPNPEPIAGDMHFDNDENWKIGNDVDLFSVALHEAGHALGLGHADKPGAVMYAYYSRATALTPTDIAAAQELYAASSTGAAGNNPAIEPTPAPAPPNPPPSTPTPSPTPSSPPQTPPANSPPSIIVSNPSAAMATTTNDRITLTGTASDASGISRVAWQTNFGYAGTAIGTASWSANGVPLLRGNNFIVIRAYDSSGNSAYRTIAVIRH